MLGVSEIFFRGRITFLGRLGCDVDVCLSTVRASYANK
jgi:hypothetical protein